MGRTIGLKQGKLVQGDQGDRKKKSANGNRRERKLKKENKELRQNVAKTSNELYRWRQRRKATRRKRSSLRN